MAKRNTRDRVIALERDVLHLSELYEKMTERTEDYMKSNSKEHTKIRVALTELNSSVDGGMKAHIKEAIQEYMPAEVIVERGWTVSDTVKAAAITAVAIVIGKIIEVGLVRW